MGWIYERIISEYRKHKTLEGASWAKLAEAKIIRQLREDGICMPNLNEEKHNGN